jgi:hypothetical protein
VLLLLYSSIHPILRKLVITMSASTSATATAAAARPADTKNLHWRSNNVGLKLLEKLGWKEGQAVGKRQRQDMSADNDTNTETVAVSSEGLRVVKRSTGLGLGASSRAESLASSHHVQHFSNLLEQLKEHHPPTASSEKESSKKSRKKAKTTTTYSTTGVVLPTNKTTHHKIRAAKFSARTADDMKCIFGGASDCTSASTAFTSIEAITNNDVSPRPSKKQKKEKKAAKEDTATDDESLKKKKKSKKDKKKKKKSSIP